jgi:zinc D-Ala-D-Ala carboxypeptidase
MDGPVTSIRFAAALLLCALLSACAFAPADSYRNYKESWGFYVANSGVNTFCMAPQLRFLLWDFERQFGRKVVVSSGFRDPFHNGKVGGADGSYHMKCMAADFFIPGVSKSRLIAYAKRNSAVGGLGCYPNKQFIHVDVRTRPRGWRQPVTFSGC